MPISQQITTFGDSFQSVLANGFALRSPRGVDIATSLYTAATQRIFPPGMFVSLHTGGKYRLLPRARTTALASTGQAIVVVNPLLAGVFIVGDVLNVIADNAAGTPGNAVGTVQSINYATGAITLAANLSAGVASGAIIGVSGAVPFAMISPNTAIDFQLNPDGAYGGYVGGNVRTGYMAHWDNNLNALFPDIITV